MKKTKVSIFCGGRGSATLIKYLATQKNIELTLLINAYDDGKSTGILRKNIPGLLGPSDFRKNFSYLIDFLSDEQRILKSIFEYRIKKKVSVKEFYNKIKELEKLNRYNTNCIPTEINYLEKNIKKKIIDYLLICTKYLLNSNINLLDFSFGNLIFAGIFLDENRNFNLTVQKFAGFINSNVKIINISNNKNRWLVAVNEKKEIIEDEAKLVEKKQIIPIKDIFLLRKKEMMFFLKNFKKNNQDQKLSYLKKMNSIPEINPEAKNNLLKSDYIIYGPGTQYSSLFPSYIIGNKTIKLSKAKKVMIMNLEHDNDIINLSTEKILIKSLKFLSSKLKTNSVIDTVLIDNNCKFNNLSGNYKETLIKNVDVQNNYLKKIHSGRKLYDEIFKKEKEKNLLLYINLIDEKSWNDEYIDQVFNQNWNLLFENITVIINSDVIKLNKSYSKILIRKSHKDFPEIDIFNSWCRKKNSKYLITISGDGFYDLSRTIEYIKLMRDLNSGILIGSRNQSRSQHFDNIKKIYGTNILLYFFSKISEFFFIFIYFFKLKFFLLDPNSGYRIYSKENFNFEKIQKKQKYPSVILKELARKKIEVLEVPIRYYVRRNFHAKILRFKYAIKNIKGLFFD